MHEQLEPTKAGPRQTASVTAVVDAALTLFSERGYHGTALSQVAKKLGLRTPSLYNHMTSKQALLQDVMIRTTDRVLADFHDAIEGKESPTEQLRSAIEAYVAGHIRFSREALIVNRDMSSLEEPVRSQVLSRSRQHERAIRAIIQAGVDTGEFHTPTPALASFAILEMGVSVARWYSPTGAIPPENTAKEYGIFALRLVGASA